MRTRPKVLLAVSLSLLILFLVLYEIISFQLIRTYTSFEREIATENVVRTADAIASRVTDLETKIGDWAQWDDTYGYVRDRNEDYIGSNLNNESFAVIKVELVSITDDAGNIIFSKHVENGEALPFPDSLRDRIVKESRLHDPSVGESVAGVTSIPEGLIVFASRPITTSDGVAAPVGRIFFGYFVDQEVQDSLIALTHLNLRLDRYDQAADNSTAKQNSPALADEKVFIPETDIDAEYLTGTILVQDALDQEPVLIVTVTMPRGILAQGQASIRIFGYTMAGASVVIIAIVLILFEVIVLRKLLRLESDVTRLRDVKSGAPFVGLPGGSDEFRSLAEEINRSLEALYQTESELEAQRNELQKFQLAAEKSFNHLIITDENGVVMYANPAAAKNTGYSNEEMVGQRPSLWGKQMPKRVYEEMWDIIKTKKQSYFGELTNRRKDGTQYLVSASITPILDAAGEVRYYIGIERDITEERARQMRDMENMSQLESANTKLASEKARAEGILRYLRSIGEGVFATDRRGTIVFVNEAAATMIGKESSELIGEESVKYFEFRHGKNQESPRFFASQNALKIRQARTFARGIFLIRQDGKPLPVSGSFAPIIEAQHIAGAIVVFQDITEQHELEKMKESFLSIAAHQLRTPLGSMRWSMELLKNGDLGKVPKKAEEALSQLYENSSRMLTIVNDLLKVSQIDQGRAKEDATSVDVAALVDEVLATLHGSIEEKGIQLSFRQPEKKIPNLTVTKGHLFEAVENLVANAVRYNREKGNIDIILTEDGKDIVITIADSGIGIPEADQKKIFSKFFRAANAVKHFTDGSGLGLSVVKSYIEENGGSVTFTSKQDIGTTFIIRLPLEPKKPVILS
ncbi:MAG: PAS domain S-box protein [Undibacterium sp.]